MENKRKEGYVYAVIMGLLTILVCLIIADGLIGIEGTIKDYKEYADGYHEFILVTSNPTGRYVFWIGLLGISVLFSWKTKIKYTWINLPVYFAAWYLCLWIFGESVKHRYLAHPAQGFISFGEGFVSLGTTVFLWLMQVIILGIMTLLRFIINKLGNKRTGGNV